MARPLYPFIRIRAARAWQRREDQKGLKPQIRALASGLRWLRVRHRVLIGDAYRTPLCDEGIDGFLRELHIFGVPVLSRMAGGWLYAIDRQVGFVPWEAHLRVSAKGKGQGGGDAPLSQGQ